MTGSSPDGFTLIEVLVSAALLTVAALGIAQLTMLATRTTETARARTATTLLAAQKMEQLRSLTMAWDSGGGLLSDTSTDLSREPPSSSGHGLSISSTGTLDRNVDGYVDYLDASGRWIGGGPSPPAGTLYVRRWAVWPLAAAPQHSRVLIVFVTKSGSEWVSGTRIVAVKTRQAVGP
jgi:prepilin-type N-terminal cleavage/methylation domain-containing protein